jgi:hypothetical protein
MGTREINNFSATSMLQGFDQMWGVRNACVGGIIYILFVIGSGNVVR